MNNNYAILEELVKGEFSLTEDTKLFNGIKFGDTVWDFYDSNNKRKSSVPRKRYHFDWNYVQENVGSLIMRDLKVLTFFLTMTPSIFNKKGLAIPTIHEDIWKVQAILKEVIAYDYNLLNIKYDPSLICIADFQLHQFEKVSIHATRFSGFKKVLRYFANPYVQRHLNKGIHWTQKDIDSLKMKILPKDPFKEIAATPIENQLYSEIIKQVTSDIISFKRIMNMDVFSGVTESVQKCIEKNGFKNVSPESFQQYLEILEKDEYESILRNKRYSGAYALRRTFKSVNGYSVKYMNDCIRRIHAAAIITILLFTGMRYSEVISLQKGCLLKRIDVFVIVGTVVKMRDIGLPVNRDEWVAIPIVRDAVEILELIQKLTSNSYLVAPLRRVYLNQADEPLSENGLSTLLNMYLKQRKLEDKCFQEFNLEAPINQLTSHRFRHSLAQQLVRGRLGIPYLSYHFKHVNTAMVAFNKFSDVTLGYGNIGRELTNSAKNYTAAKAELFEQIYSPTAVVVGGQNATDFMQRKTEYYQGLMVNDEEVNDIIEDLKSQSLPFLDVGLGYCGGRKDRILKDGTKEPPPCIGHLKCNPLDCGNAVIPKSKLPMWEEMYKDANLKLANPEFEYMNVELKEIIKRAETVINQFR